MERNIGGESTWRDGKKQAYNYSVIDGRPGGQKSVA